MPYDSVALLLSLGTYVCRCVCRRVYITLDDCKMGAVSGDNFGNETPSWIASWLYSFSYFFLSSSSEWGHMQRIIDWKRESFKPATLNDGAILHDNNATQPLPTAVRSFVPGRSSSFLLSRSRFSSSSSSSPRLVSTVRRRSCFRCHLLAWADTNDD